MTRNSLLFLAPIFLIFTINMIAPILEAISFPFFTRGLLVGGLLALTCALLGNFVILRREAIIGHTISNIALLGITLGLFLNVDLNLATIIAVLVGVMVILFLQTTETFSHDSILELTAQISMAASVVMISQLSGYRTDLMQFLFGSILAISKTDVWLTATLSVVVLATLWLIRKPLLQVVFNTELAIAGRVNTNRINAIFMLALSLTVAIGIKIVGVILLASFLVIPANTAKVLAGNFKQMVVLSGFFGVIGTMIGLFLSYFWDVPSGPMIILTFGVILFFIMAAKRIFR
ncbi:hypothetical protein COY07_02630 [Candidatus Peregrinibacteria bacterium CG_4_10_14_0_2_um_filter_43_11]|nr:MAG: hypothetical protein COY07_02630 [Candidatus Peregrinibacteria bacterium CG_4_10_14_0_2_um_filter_43_11]